MLKLPHTVIISLLAAFALAACSERKSDVAAEKPPRPVKFLKVESSSNIFPLSFPAVVKASRSTTLTFQVGGLVKELPVIRSQVVKRGDLIAKLDDRDYRSSAAAAKAEYDNAQTEFSRAEQLVKKGAISASVRDQRRSQREIARARYEQAAKALEDATLVAPFDGLIADLNIEQFQNVDAQTSVAVLQTDGALEATINLPAQIVSQSPTITPTDTVIVLESAPNVRIPAKFKELTTQADPTNQTYRASFTFEAPENITVLPGMTGTISTQMVYEGDLLQRGLSVPFSAITQDGDQRYVWVVDPETMLVEKRPVEVADQVINEGATIIAGLEKEETIVGAGAAYLVEGMRVREWKR